MPAIAGPTGYPPWSWPRSCCARDTASPIGRDCSLARWPHPSVLPTNGCSGWRLSAVTTSASAQNPHRHRWQTIRCDCRASKSEAIWILMISCVRWRGAGEPRSTRERRHPGLQRRGHFRRDIAQRSCADVWQLGDHRRRSSDRPTPPVRWPSVMPSSISAFGCFTNPIRGSPPHATPVGNRRAPCSSPLSMPMIYGRRRRSSANC